MKPDWKDAPEWAKWLAMDADGQWYWFDKQPVAEGECWWAYGARYQMADAGITWKSALEERP